MQSRPNTGALDSRVSQGGKAESLTILLDSSCIDQKPQHASLRQNAVDTQSRQHGTIMSDRRRRADRYPLIDGISHVMREAAALARLSLPDTGAPFAHMGKHIMRMGRPHPGHIKASAELDSAAAAPDSYSSSVSLEHTHKAADQMASNSEHRHMHGDLTKRSDDRACSAAQPEVPQQGRKKRRRAPAPFACASASASSGAEDSSSPGEWKWPQLPKWKPPRYGNIMRIQANDWCT